MEITERLVELQNGEPTTTSRQVAEVFGKEHRAVLKAIDDVLDALDDAEGVAQNYAAPMFSEETYVHEQNHQEYRQFRMNKDGFVLLVSGFTGKKALKFKLDYISKFNAMEHYIQEQQQAQFFAPETVEQQIKREQLAIAKQNSDNAKSREVRSWLKLTKNDPEAVKMAAGKVMSLLLDVPESQLKLATETTYPYTAAEIGETLGREAYSVGKIAQKLGLKATREEGSNKYTKNVKIEGAGSKWLYSREGLQAIADYLWN